MATKSNADLAREEQTSIVLPLTLPDGTSLTLSIAPHEYRWKVGNRAILTDPETGLPASERNGWFCQATSEDGRWRAQVTIMPSKDVAPADIRRVFDAAGIVADRAVKDSDKTALTLWIDRACQPPADTGNSSVLESARKLAAQVTAPAPATAAPAPAQK